MEKRQLGKTDLHIAPIVFGGNVFGWTADAATSFKLLDNFTANGFNCIDTADIYSHWAPGNVGGESESIIGNWMKQTGNRKDIVISTKVGGAGKQPKPNTSKKYILQTVEKSLQRLQTDYIDLYQTHFDDKRVAVEETLSAYDELIKSGKVRWIGASNLSEQRLKDAFNKSAELNLPQYQTLQPEYNLYSRERYEKEYEPIAEQYGLGVISYYSLASGFLTGKYRSAEDKGKSARGGGMDKYLNERGFKILAALDEVAAAYNTTPTVIALAWLIARPSITAPIVSATKLEQLTELMQAAAVKLTDADMKLLDDVSQ